MGPVLPRRPWRRARECIQRDGRPLYQTLRVSRCTCHSFIDRSYPGTAGRSPSLFILFFFSPWLAHMYEVTVLSQRGDHLYLN